MQRSTYKLGMTVQTTGATSHVATKRTLPLLVESDHPEQFSLFPDELGGGVVITQDEILQLSCVYSRFYEIYISRLSARLSDQFDLTKSSTRMLTRRALVPLIHCFMDRLVRIKKAIDCAPGQLTTPRQELFPAPDTVEAFEECSVTNPAFNQSVIWFVGRVWQLPESDSVPEKQPFTLQVGFKNNLFDLYPRTPWGLIKNRWLKLMALLPKSRFPTLGMSNATGAFFHHGFYSKYLGDVNSHWPLAVESQNRTLRETLFSDAFIKNSELSEFLAKLGLGVKEEHRVYEILGEFLRLYYPTSLLEAIPQNMNHAAQALRPFKKKALISWGGRGACASYVAAAAKRTGLTIVDHQHGGHYGYIEDMSGVLELEYPGVDQFVSWGWLRLPDHPSVKGMSVIRLPSPWLSERKRYWAGIKGGGEKEFDILLMPNMLKRFPETAQGASTARIDLIQEVGASLKHLVREATAQGVRILHKPFNPTTVNLLAKTMQELESIGGLHYFCERQLDKGLTYELVERCHVVLWDQPGTGFLECLSSQIPTMVYWLRLYNHEEAWVQPIFTELERLGIVHRNVDALLDELQRFKKSPHAWMNNPERASLISRFCREFAWTSDDWPEHWQRYLDELSNG